MNMGDSTESVDNFDTDVGISCFKLIEITGHINIVNYCMTAVNSQADILTPRDASKMARLSPAAHPTNISATSLLSCPPGLTPSFPGASPEENEVRSKARKSTTG